MSRTDEILAPKRAYLRDNEAAYLRAREYVKSPQYGADQMKALAKIDRIMVANHTSEQEALWRLGRIRQVLDDLKEAENLILEYESTKQSVTQMAARTQ